MTPTAPSPASATRRQHRYTVWLSAISPISNATSLSCRCWRRVCVVLTSHLTLAYNHIVVLTEILKRRINTEWTVKLLSRCSTTNDKMIKEWRILLRWFVDKINPLNLLVKHLKNASNFKFTFVAHWLVTRGSHGYQKTTNDEHWKFWAYPAPIMSWTPQTMP